VCWIGAIAQTTVGSTRQIRQKEEGKEQDGEEKQEGDDERDEMRDGEWMKWHGREKDKDGEQTGRRKRR
jgi:hypothetical protein